MNEKKAYKREHFKEISSTNDYAKQKRGKKENLLITAELQTGGRGTKGRGFSSNEGGVYLTKLDFYEGFLAKDSFQIMISSAAAVCETLAFFGVKPCIKWPNDVFVNGKKICGILIENTFSGNRIVNSIVGIGLNVNNFLEEELLGIATTMQKETGKRFSVERVREKLIEELLKVRGLETYRQYLGFLGEEVTLVLETQSTPAILLFVDDRGRLWAKVNGEEKAFSSAEVSVKVR